MLRYRMRWASLWVCAVVAAGASGQIVPERLYFGVDARIVVQVGVPEALADAEAEIRLHDWESGEVVASSAAVAGRADLAGLLPEIWEERSTRTRLAQLYAGGLAVGAPLVLQPLVTPNKAALVDPSTMEPSMDPRAAVVFEDDRLPALAARGLVETGERAVTYSGVRAYVDREVVVETTEGSMVFRLRPDAAPNTSFNFLHLVEGGFYTGVIVHRVVAALTSGDPFVIQFGDLSGTGLGGPGYMVDLERGVLGHAFGVLSMARGTDPNSNGSQVFVCLSRAGTAFLDGRYTAFAEAVSGADTIRAIAGAEVDADDRPVDPPVVVRAYTRDAPAFPDRPEALWRIEATIEADAGGR
ncbi:MAG: peptidylprolyl isomerase [Planctomycetota bacterium]